MIKLESHFKKIESQIQSLPDKLNFKIGEAGGIVGAPNHVLRYWEKEFPILKPEKWTNRQRLYSKKDIKILLLIKCLLYEEKFSIEGLRKHIFSYCQRLNQYKKSHQDPTPPVQEKIQRLLKSILNFKDQIQNQPEG